MNEHTPPRKVPPAIFVGGVMTLVISAVAAVAIVSASTSERIESRGKAAGLDTSERAVSSTEVVPAGTAIRTQLAQNAQHAAAGLEAMAPSYAPAVVWLEVTTDAAADPKRLSAFFAGAGQLAAPRSAMLGATKAEVVLDQGQRFEVGRVIADAPDADLVLLSVDLPNALMRGLQAAFLEPLPGETLLMIGPADQPGVENPTHPTALLEVERVRVVDQTVRIELGGPMPEWALGAPLLNDRGKLGGYVARDALGANRVYGGERLLRLEALPGVTLAQWKEGVSVESTRPPPETADLWAEIRALPRPEGFDPAPKAFAGFDVRPAKIERAEGGIRLDDRFVVPGSGTESDPYVVPWAMLMSASETFNPSRGQLVLPERVSMLDGQWVRLEGNFAIPFSDRFIKELLLMQHPWDGCCLGVPPTPYDAIEVALAEPTSERPQFGSLVGRFRVDPFVRGQWLYGMFLMEGARLVRPAGAEGN